jgi:hypothetical protein
MRILVKVINAVRIKATRASLDAMDNIPFFDKKFCEIRTILTGDSGD